MRKIIKLSLYLGSLILLSGCVGTGGTAIKESYTAKVVHEIDMNWQEAFRILRNQTIECYQGGGGWSGTGMVDAQLYSELGEGEIQVNNGSWGTYLYIEVKKSEGPTVVTGYSGISTWNRTLNKLKPVIVDGKETFDFGC